MVSFELVDPNGAELPAFSAGSHIDVTIPGGFSAPILLCNSTSERNRYVIGVWNDGNSRGGPRRCMDSACGRHLASRLARNRFRVSPQYETGHFAGKGIGVTPILSIADYLKSQNIPFELHYVFAMMSPGSFLE